VSAGTALLLILALAQVGQGDGPQEGAVGFRALEGDRVRVFYQEGDSARSARILAFAEGQVPLAGLPPGIPSDVTIYVARSEGAFDRVTGSRIPDWGSGVAIPSQRMMVLPLFASGRGRGVDLRTVLRHEWAHLGLHEHLDGMRVPRWFDEGYAQWASGGWDAMEGWRLRVAFATGRAPPLDSLELSWPRDRGSAELAYGLSATVLEYLVEESGVRGLEILLDRWPEMGFDRALRSTYGITQGQLERDWQKYVKQRYGWVLVLSHSLLFWAALSLALVVMVLIRRRRNREAMARLVAGEGPDRPAFWLGEPGEPIVVEPVGPPSSWTSGPSGGPRPSPTGRPRLVWSTPLRRVGSAGGEGGGAGDEHDAPDREGSNEAPRGYDDSDPETPTP
jgi:hypothetical protein